MFRTKPVGLGTAADLATAATLLPAGIASAAPASDPTAPGGERARAIDAIPVHGIAADGTQVTGQITDLTFRVVDGAVTAFGTISLPGEGTATFTAPVQAVGASGSCTILTLDLGALHLALLGLVVDLGPVSLDITAVAGSGDLRGAVAHLLDDTGGSGGAVHGLSTLLNRLLSSRGL